MLPQLGHCAKQHSTQIPIRKDDTDNKYANVNIFANNFILYIQQIMESVHHSLSPLFAFANCGELTKLMTVFPT